MEKYTPWEFSYKQIDWRPALNAFEQLFSLSLTIWLVSNEATLIEVTNQLKATAQSGVCPCQISFRGNNRIV